MESKVLLFNERNEKVGDTYIRRARQLVSQQRAAWVDDSHSAIRFAPDDDLNDIAAASAVSGPVMDTREEERPKASAKAKLYALAEKRLHERKMFLLHTLLQIPEYLIIALIGDNGSGYFGFFLFGCVLTAYAIHAWAFLRARLRGFSLTNREENHARRLAIEMDKLKRMGYAE